MSIEIDIDDVTIADGPTPNPGCRAVVASHQVTNCPIGYLWWVFVLRNNIDILNVYTHEYFRRQGIATKMLNQLKVWYPDTNICTGVGNKLSIPWLIKNGFVDEGNGWFLRPDRPEEPCPMI
jgi:GNAT superfamily N-acetyltransferase